MDPMFFFLEVILGFHKKDATLTAQCLCKILWDQTEIEKVGAVLKRLRDPDTLSQLFDTDSLKHRNLLQDAFREEAGNTPMRTDKEYVCDPLTCVEILVMLSDKRCSPEFRRTVLDAFASAETMMSEILTWMGQYPTKVKGPDMGECCARHGISREEVRAFFFSRVPEKIFLEILHGFEHFAK